MKCEIIARRRFKAKKTGTEYGVITLSAGRDASGFFQPREVFVDPALIDKVTQPGEYECDLGLGEFGNDAKIVDVKLVRPWPVAGHSGK